MGSKFCPLVFESINLKNQCKFKVLEAKKTLSESKKKTITTAVL